MSGRLRRPDSVQLQNPMSYVDEPSSKQPFLKVGKIYSIQHIRVLALFQDPFNIS